MKQLLFFLTCMSVYVTAIAQCIPPSGIYYSSVWPYTSATISWSQLSGSGGYYAYYMYWYNPNDTSQHTNFQGWNPTNNDPFTTSTSIIINTTPGNYYTIAIRPACDSNAWSYYSFIPPCPLSLFTPTTYFPSFDSIVLYWSSTPANGYYIEHRLQGDSTWITSPFVWEQPSNANNSYSLPQPLVAGLNYEYRIISVCPYNYSISAVNTTSLASCNVVSNLNVNAILCNSATVNFTNTTPTNLINNYTIQYWAVNDSANTFVSTNYSSTNNQLQYPLNSLLASTVYKVRVRTQCIAGYYSAWVSTIITTSNPSIVCNPPSGFAPSLPLASGTGFTVSWIQSAPNILQHQWRYKKSSDPSTAWGSIQNVSAAIYSIPIIGLIPGTNYDVQLRSQCINCNATSSWTTLSYATVCPQPVNLTVPSSSITSFSALAKWSSNTYAANYTVSKKAQFGNWDSVCLATPDSFCLLNNLISGTNYQCNVTSNCSGGATSMINTLSFHTPCAASSGLQVVVSNSTALVAWNSVSGGLTYKLEYRNSSGSFGSWVTVNNNISANTFTITSIPSSYTEIDIRLTTNCHVGNGNQAQTLLNDIAMGCAPPVNISATALNSTQTLLTWDSISGANSYKLQYRNADANGSAGAWSPTITVTGSTFILHNLLFVTNYQFRLRTECFDNELSDSYSVIYTYKTPCPPITGLMVTPALNTAFIKWNKVSSVNSYKIQHGLVNALGQVNTWITNYNSGDSDTDINLSSLTSASNYIIRVQVKCTNNNGDTSVFVSQSFNTLSPCSPPSFNIDSVSYHSISVSWSALLGAGVQNYRIRYKATASPNWDSTGLLSSSNYMINNLTPGTTYQIQIKALCGTNTSTGYSASYNSTTIACVNVPGRSFANPIVFGTISSVWQSNTQVNATANCFSNNYIGSTNNPSNDIWYQFILTSNDSIEISHCNSIALNTCMHLLDSGGTEIALCDSNGPICLGQKASIRMYLTAGTYYIVSELINTTSNSITTAIRKLPPLFTNLTVRAFIEGYYSDILTMTPALYNQGYSNLPITSIDVERVRVEIRNANPPYNLIRADSVLIKNNGYMNWEIPLLSGNYYLVLKSRNAIETWSANPILISSVTNYDFSSASSKAYGSNQTEVESGVWAIYSGDISQDENIDLIDLSGIETDINNFQFGYFATDINGDGNVDLLDGPTVENNISNFIFSNHP